MFAPSWSGCFAQHRARLHGEQLDAARPTGGADLDAISRAPPEQGMSDGGTDRDLCGRPVGLTVPDELVAADPPGSRPELHGRARTGGAVAWGGDDLGLGEHRLQRGDATIEQALLL